MSHLSRDQYQEEDVFDPKIHLSYKEPDVTFTLADLGLEQPEDSTPIAGTLPFPLLSREGVLAYRRSIMRPEIVKATGRPVGSGTVIMRNVSKMSKFVSDFWSHPETNAIVSKALGISVAPIMPMEMGHTNIQITGDQDIMDQLQVEPSAEPTPQTEEEKNYDPLGTNSVIPWHYDSYPYVCIIMLSDTTHMNGGDTYIKTGTGAVRKVEGPCLGSAVVLQGGQVQHIAARAFGSAERITTISSYRATPVGSWDNSFISNVRPYDNLSQLYSQWSVYRLQKMKQEIEAMEAQILANEASEEAFPHKEIEALCARLSDYSARTARQMVDPAIRDEMIAKFTQAGISKAPKQWVQIRANPDNQAKIAKAIEMAEDMPEMRKYILDWNETRAKLERDITETSQHGPFVWDKKEKYQLPDELTRQGLKEVLLHWMEKTDLLGLGG